MRMIAPPRTAAAIFLLMAMGCVKTVSPAFAEGNLAQPAGEIRELIRQLGDDAYTVREHAQQELAKLGFVAYDAIQAATTDGDLEVATRARYLLALIRTQWTTPSDPPEVREILEDYGFRSQDDRWARIRSLARLREGAGIAALCRLVRFEKSELLSKLAAIEILHSEPADASGRTRLGETLREQLGESRRPGALWLLACLDLRHDPKSAQAAWSDLVEAERTLLQKAPEKTSPHIVAALMYYLAEVQVELGTEALADETARRARHLSPGNHPSQLYSHLEMANALQRRGLFRWAEAEYRQIIEAGVPEYAVVSQRTLAEMWHDQANDQAAAQTLADSLQVLEKLPPQKREAFIADEKGVRARMNYFLACHWADQGDRAKQVEHLELALKDDPAEIDTLIACWRLPDQSEEFRRRIGDLIDRAAAELKQGIGDPPEDANACNQFAWLVGNTKGDFDEALSYSLKAVEMSPNSGAFYDTLAHVYHAKGDYENAVKTQTRAVELEPHSGLILRQLNVFRAALEKQQTRPAQAGEARSPAEPSKPAPPASSS